MPVTKVRPVIAIRNAWKATKKKEAAGLHAMDVEKTDVMRHQRKHAIRRGPTRYLCAMVFEPAILVWQVSLAVDYSWHWS